MSKAPTLWRSTVQAAILGAAGAAVMLAAQLFLFPGLVRAVEIDVDATCVRSCIGDLRSCIADEREELVSCSLEGDSIALQAASRLACQAGGSSACIDARAEFHDGIAPCQKALRQGIKTCENDSRSCLQNDCEFVGRPEERRRVDVSAVR